MDAQGSTRKASRDPDVGRSARSLVRFGTHCSVTHSHFIRVMLRSTDRVASNAISLSFAAAKARGDTRSSKGTADGITARFVVAV